MVHRGGGSLSVAKIWARLTLWEGSGPTRVRGFVVEKIASLAWISEWKIQSAPP